MPISTFERTIEICEKSLLTKKKNESQFYNTFCQKMVKELPKHNISSKHIESNNQNTILNHSINLYKADSKKQGYTTNISYDDYLKDAEKMVQELDRQFVPVKFEK